MKRSRFEREEGPLYIPVVVTLLNTVSRSSKAEAGLSPQKLGGQLRSQISTSLSPQMPSRNNNSQAEPSWQITTLHASRSCYPHLNRLQHPEGRHHFLQGFLEGSL